MNVEVTSVSKKEQKLSQTAAAIFVITAEDIRRSGATNIPDLLRMVPGMDVAQINGSTWAISARGFNQQFSNKLLVLIDGRIVYTSTFAGVFWDTMDLPLEDIERIEVIRGPGGAIWGANAVNGVVNIITKKAEKTRGTLVTAGGGNVQEAFGMTQYGGKLSSQADYRVYAKYFNQDQMKDLTGQDGADGWHTLRGGFRIDSTLSSKDSLTVEGDASVGREGEFGFELPSITSPGFVPVAEEIDSTDSSVASVWRHVFSPKSETTLQVSFDRHVRDDPLNPEVRDTLDANFQHHLAWVGRQDIVWGLGYRCTPDTIEGSLTVSMNPESRRLQMYGGFVQDEIALVPDRLYLTVGTKLEHDDYAGLGLMPNIRMAWAPTDHHMFWSAVSRTFRAPSRNDTNLVLNIGDIGTSPGGLPILLRLLGNPDFEYERLIAYEAGYRATISDRVSLDLSAYFNDYDHLQTTEPGTPFPENSPAPPHIVQPLMYENLMFGETHGAEIAGKWQVTHRWRLSPGYALELIHMHTQASSMDTQTVPFLEGAVPRHGAQLRSTLALKPGLDWNTSAYFVDRLIHQGPGDVVIPAHTRLDANITWKLKEGLSIAFVGQDLLKDNHVEFEDVNGSLQSSRVRRGGFVKFEWRF